MLFLPVIWGWDNRTVTELSFAHVTTNTLTYSGVFGVFRKKTLAQKKAPPPPKLLFFNNDRNAPKKLLEQ